MYISFIKRDFRLCDNFYNWRINENTTLSVNILPNQTEGSVTVSFTGIEAQLIIRDIHGKQIVASTINQKVLVSIQQLESGIYLFEVNLGENSIIQRVVKH